MLLLFLGPAVAGEVIGEVVFLAQDAWRQSADGTRTPLRLGAKIEVRDTLETGPNAQLHLKMIDDAFLALRPNTTLLIRDYHAPTPAAPERGILLEVLRGSVRSVTGRIGEAHKQHFRLNTPIAAIGIRGTDFSVLADQTRVHANVIRGAIVMAPISAECPRDALGACSGDKAVLAIASANSYIELSADQSRPVIVNGVLRELLPLPEEEQSQRRHLPVSSVSAGPGVPFTVVGQTPPAPVETEQLAAQQTEITLTGELANRPLTDIPLAPELGNGDRDRDGLSDQAERAQASNPFRADTDEDGIPDPQDAQPHLSQNYTPHPGAAPIRLTEQQLHNLQIDSIRIRQAGWGNDRPLIEEITLLRTDEASPAQLTVERRQDAGGNIFWGDANSFGLLEEALRAHPEALALSPERYTALLQAGASPENAALNGVHGLNYHTAPPATPTVINTSRYLVATEGLQAASLPDINQNFPAFNLFYTLAQQDVERSTAGQKDNLPVVDFDLKMNYADQTFLARLVIFDPRPGQPDARTEIEFRGNVSASGMIFGGNDQAYLKGFFLNEMRQLAFLFETQDARGTLGGTIIAERDPLHTDLTSLKPRMALYQTRADAPVLWGRWDNFAKIQSPADLQPLLTSGRELVAYNNTFALLRPNPADDLALPTKGQFTFKMVDQEALLRRGQGVEVAQILHPTLDIDFDRQRFDTHLGFAAPSLATPIGIDASGTLQRNGTFLSDPALSNSTVAGFLGQGANQAGMLFERHLDDGAQATGVVHWQRR